MDKDSKLLGSDKIWVCSQQFAYEYYTQFVLCKSNLKKKVPWVGLQFVIVAFSGQFLYEPSNLTVSDV